MSGRAAYPKAQSDLDHLRFESIDPRASATESTAWRSETADLLKRGRSTLRVSEAAHATEVDLRLSDVARDRQQCLVARRDLTAEDLDLGRELSIMRNRE